MAPLRVADGSIVLVNRGFVDAAHRDPATRSAPRSAATVRVTGLLRMSAPGGAFLRHNDPDHGRWYSRDVAATAPAQGLARTKVEPSLIDADATPERRDIEWGKRGSGSV